jgi:iron complex transport system substrate-binding protein
VWLAATGAPAGDATAEALRVVSLSPVGTEIVLALGLADRLVAVDAASAALPGLRGLPVAASATAGDFSPDLVLVPQAEAEAARRSAPAARLVEVALHDYDEGWALCHAIGDALGRVEEARRFVRETSRPLAELSARSFGKRRPRVAAVLALEPLVVAGGHSFVTDLIELAGGESLTHGTEEPRLAWPPEAVVSAAPELVVVVTPQPPSPDARALAARAFGASLRVEFLVLDAERQWLTAGLASARRLHGWVEELRRP